MEIWSKEHQNYFHVITVFSSTIYNIVHENLNMIGFMIWKATELINKFQRIYLISFKLFLFFWNFLSSQRTIKMKGESDENAAFHNQKKDLTCILYH